MENKMFDPKKWIESVPKIVDTTINVAGETIKIKRLTGIQWEHYVKISQNTTDESSIATVLHYGLINEQSADRRFTLQEMVEFADSCPARADKIASEILKITLAVIAEEEKAIKDSEKNSANPDTRLPSAVGVGTTDKTRAQPMPVGVN
jgi:hypothetical protein